MTEDVKQEADIFEKYGVIYLKLRNRIFNGI